MDRKRLKILSKELIEIPKNILPSGETRKDIAMNLAAVQMKYFSLPEAAALAATSKNLNNLFKPMLDKIILQKLLVYIARGLKDNAEQILSDYPRLALKKGEVTDCSGRTFKNITAFQYALWALDEFMWEMIYKYLDKEEARSQMLEIERGIKYYIGEAQVESEPSSHFNYKFYLKLLEIYVKQLWGEEGWVSRAQTFLHEFIGKEQLNLPVNLVHDGYYKGYHLIPIDIKDHWYSDRHGIDFAFCRGFGVTWPQRFYSQSYVVNQDFETIKALAERRISKLNEFKKELSTRRCWGFR